MAPTQGVSVSDVSNKTCKRCKKVPQTGLKCVNCDSISHPGCLKLLENIQFIDDKTVKCCNIVNRTNVLMDDRTDQDVDEINISFSSANDLTEDPSKLETKYLKELLRHKDIYITSLEDKISILKEHILLIKNINKPLTETPPVEIPNNKTNLKFKTNKNDSQKAKSATKAIPPSISQNAKSLGNDTKTTISKNCTSQNEGQDNKSNYTLTTSSSAVLPRCGATDTKSYVKQNQNKITKKDVATALESVNAMNKTKDDKDGYTTVRYKKRMNKSSVVGSMNDFSTNKLKAMDNLAFLHVYKMHRDITTEDLTEYLRTMFPEVICDKMKSKYPQYYSAFKVTIYRSNLEAAMSPSIWPAGTVIDRFFHKLAEKTKAI